MRKITVSEVAFYPIRPTEKGLIGFASVLFDNQLSLNSIAIYTKPAGNGIRCLFPSKRLINGKEISLFYPINKLAANTIMEAIAKKIEEVAEKAEDFENGKRKKNNTSTTAK